MTAREALKNTILDLLEKYSADDLTVKMICMESGYSKQTLYNNYYNWMDALEEAYRAELFSTLGTCDNYLAWVEGFRRSLVFMQSRRRAFLHVYNSSRQDEMLAMIRRSGCDLVSRGIDDVVRDFALSVSDKDYDFMLSFYMDVFMGIIGRYFREGMKEDPDYLAHMCDVMMRYHIRNTLRNLNSEEFA